jgi:signal transduction histidine kinase
MLASVFGYLVTRLALTPTRNALENQKQFVGNIAHELRTPLSIIKTNTEVALLANSISTDMRETLESNVEELNRISGIINNLLSMNLLLRPEKMEFANINLKTIIDRVFHALDGLSKKKNVMLGITGSEYQTVWGNESGVEQILMNVVKNAINYTPAGGSVTIHVEANFQNEVEVAVTDTGVGIPEKDLAYIFEPFYRGDASRNRQGGAGSGLGLAIVNELVKIHKGSIAIRSSEGTGTSVEIHLPRGRKEKAPTKQRAS